MSFEEFRSQITRGKRHKFIQVFEQVVNKLCSHCLFLVCCKKFETICQQLVTGLMVLSDYLQGCSNKSNNTTRMLRR